MPYDAQGRWIEENEWEQMMRELAAQRVQAFSRYNDAPPSLYPNQAAPYRSFPYADPTPAIWDTSPDSILNPAVPSDPKYQGWGFNQEPIADTSAVSGIPFTGLQTVSGTQSMEDILANAQKSQGVKTDIQNLIEMYGDPSTEVTDDPYAAPVSDPNIVTSGPLVPDQSRWDMLPAVPGTGDAIPMPNMEVDQPIATGMVQAGFTTGGTPHGGPGNIDHLGNVFSVQNKNPLDLGTFIMPSYRPENQTEVLPITVPVLPGLATALTAGAVTAATAGEGVQPGEPYSGMGDPSDAFSTGHPGMMGATGYEPTTAGMANVFTGAGDYTGDPDPGLEDVALFEHLIGGVGLKELAKLGITGVKGLKNFMAKSTDTLTPAQQAMRRTILKGGVAAGTLGAAGKLGPAAISRALELAKTGGVETFKDIGIKTVCS